MGRAAKAIKKRRAAAAAAANAGPVAPPAGPAAAPPAAAAVPLRVNLKIHGYIPDIERAVTENPDSRITFGIERGQMANYGTLKAMHLEIQKHNRLKGRKDTFTMAETLNVINADDMEPTGFEKKVGDELRFRG
ncbi:hypothetical protein L195_g047799 [Trifolium pratense]|uniref:Uncharacterized protein n=1 Tax=Trifolium pratense TaxID=57577 RepID=A0A2K3MLK5_TRIPR|nr:hypothetical protein L195_g047799 [Trifolium pratense]